MRRATLAEVCEWVLVSWASVPTATIQRAFAKGKIIDSPTTLDADSDASVEEPTNNAQASLDADFLELFVSDSDSDFNGFETE